MYYVAIQHLENHWRAPVVILSLVGKAREAVLELDMATLNADHGMEKLYQKLDTLFLEDANQAAFMAYESFEKYQRQNVTPVEDFLINFDRHVPKLKEHNILLLEPVLAYRALKSANLSSQNERLIKATVSKLMLCEMSKQQKKIMHKGSDAPSPSPITVKNETDISYKEEEETTHETFYGHYYNRNPSFSVQHGKGHNKNATRSTDKNINTIAPQGKTTKCFTYVSSIT